MKPLYRVATALFALGLVLLSCSQTPADDPKSVASAFLDASKNLDFNKAAEYATDRAKQYLLLAGMLKSGISAEQQKSAASAKIEVVGVDISGDTANVRYKRDLGPEQSLPMIKENGLWKVDFQEQL